MIDPKKIEQLARQIHDAMPKGIRELGDDVEKRIRQTLQAQLTRLDVVNREEFDVQTQVLLRTREKLAALEQRLSALENRTESSASSVNSSQHSAPAGGVEKQDTLAAAKRTEAPGNATSPVTSAPAAPTSKDAEKPKDSA